MNMIDLVLFQSKLESRWREMVGEEFNLEE